ncbi:unnamed protein product [Ixodes pacificus]
MERRDDSDPCVHSPFSPAFPAINRQIATSHSVYGTPSPVTQYAARTRSLSIPGRYSTVNIPFQEAFRAPYKKAHGLSVIQNCLGFSLACLAGTVLHVPISLAPSMLYNSASYFPWLLQHQVPTVLRKLTKY